MTFGVPFEELEVGGYRLRVKRAEDGIALYSRFDGEKEVVKIAVDPNLSLTVVPVEPFLNPRRDVVECVYLRLDPPITVRAGGNIEHNTYIPIDFAVVAQKSGEDFRVVDSFVNKGVVPKMALYGVPTNGYICRYFLATPLQEPKVHLSPVKLIINNNTEKVATVRNVVVPLQELAVFYKPGTWISYAAPIIMNIESETVAEISMATPEPPSADFERSPELPKRGIDIVEFGRDFIGLKELVKFKMIWGY
ncbi:MAG: DUF432 domain-containing protein [Acidilobaceae archaeon]|nr:DUF432 domain-containing protein [Acidilobaceae archaeon]MCX8165884.1 DUF432 domain-containing protein [Acidilobaceae archaeon]MDW7974526.1 DUF432 domain-containing protein [Sulfolobales archaeon]